MPDSKPTSETVKERFRRELAEYAGRIKTVCNEVFPLKIWQLVLNFVLAAGAIAFLVLSMFDRPDGLKPLFIVLGIVFVAAVVVYNIVIRARAPISFMQYTVITKDGRYLFQVVSKTRSVFSDGENVVEADKYVAKTVESVFHPECAFDFFVNMDPEVRIGKPEGEIYKGTVEVDGKTKKCSIEFRGGVPFKARIAGVRMKYFDVNDSREEFVVPGLLFKAARTVEVPWPAKLPGLRVRDVDRRT